MNLTNRKSKEELNKLRPKVNKILFFRVCGTGMGAAACLLKEIGFDVYGTDRDYFPPMSTYLEEKRIPKVSFDGVDFSEYDLVVVGNVVARASEDARKIEESGTPFCSFPEIIGEYILKDKVVIGVSGTHGKTTTTYMLIQLMENLGVKPGYFLGGVIDGRASSSLGDSDYFVIESDEYDTAYFEKTPKFNHYHINHLILTSLEYDHADIYSSLDQIKKAFQYLTEVTSGKIIYNQEYVAIDFISDNEKRFVPFGKNTSQGPKNISYTESVTHFELYDQVVRSNIFGFHNILNLSSAMIMLKELGFNLEKLLQACADIKLVKRRQEKLGVLNGVVYYDDFAHHPTAMRLTLESFLEKFPSQLLSVIFEPASSTARSNVFENEFLDALKKANRVFIIKPMRDTSAIGAGNINIEKLSDQLNSSSVPTTWGSLAELESFINATTSGIVLFMSNGKLLGIKEKIFK